MSCHARKKAYKVFASYSKIRSNILPVMNYFRVSLLIFVLNHLRQDFVRAVFAGFRFSVQQGNFVRHPIVVINLKP